MTTRSGKLHVLLLSGPESECANSLQQVLAPHVEFTTANSLAECLRQVAKFGCSAGRAGRSPAEWLSQQGSGFDAFLCEWCYQGGTWKEAVESIRSEAPELPVIVVCRTGGEAEWIEVLQAGASDLLSAPFSEEEVLAALSRAVSSPTERALMKTA